MNILPAIDLLGGKAVRLKKGDYDRVTVYSDTPAALAKQFEACGAKHLHIVDLDGARDGAATNLDTVCDIVASCGLSVEVGGGIRNLSVLERYATVGVDRLILGTAAVTDEAFLRAALARFGKRIAVGVDIRDGYVAIHGWRKTSDLSCLAFCEKLESLGVQTVICTDISKDGMLSGANHDLYRSLSERFSLRLIASGGVSSLTDVRALSEMGLYGAIVGKALYEGTLSLSDAIRVAEEGAK